MKDSVGLYRDDGLAVIENANGPLLDRLRKKIIALFKDEELSITIETNLSVTDFFDVTLDLSRGKYYPYRKPNDKPLYINASSNHIPPPPPHDLNTATKNDQQKDLRPVLHSRGI